MSPEALSAAVWATVSHGSDLLLTIDWQDGSRRETTWFPVGDVERFERMLAYHLREGNDPKVGLVPRRDQHLDGLAPGQVLWASVENPVSVRSLNAFRPVPSLLFRKGSRRVAVWWLDRPLPMRADPREDWLTRANKRLAFALKANSRHADPAWLMPVWELVNAEPTMYPVGEVVGRLRDAPVRSIPSLLRPRSNTPAARSTH